MKQFRKKDKMYLSTLEPLKSNPNMDSPISGGLIHSQHSEKEFSIKSQFELDQSFGTENSDLNDMFKKTNISAGETVSHIMNSSGKSDVSFRSEMQPAGRYTERFYSTSQKQDFYIIKPKDYLSGYLSIDKFKKEFISSVQICIFSAPTFNNIERLLSTLGDLKINHPFIEPSKHTSKTILSYQKIMDLWISEFQTYKKLILSFDFLFSHLGLILCLFFYYSQILSRPTNPLLSLNEELNIELKQRDELHTILKILFEYIWHRARDMTSYPLISILLNNFYNYVLKVTTDDEFVLQFCQKSKQVLYSCQQYQLTIQNKLKDGKECIIDHLQQIRLNYQQKDKFIKDQITDIADLFNEISRRTYVNSSLGFYYQVNNQQNTKKNQARKLTILHNWLLSIVVDRCRTNAYTALDYLLRFFQICRIFVKKNNLECLLFFSSVLLNIKQYIPSLWKKFTKYKLSGAEEELQKMVEYYQNFKFTFSKKQVVIFQFLKINKIIEGLKLRHTQKGYLSIIFHQDIQDCARKILHYRKLVENQLMNDTRSSKTIKINLNYRFMSYYLYEYMEKNHPNPEQDFEKLKKDMEDLDSKIYYPFKFF